MSTRKIWKFWWNSKTTLQWKVPVKFDPSIILHPEYNCGYGIMSNPSIYSIPAQSSIDDSFILILETISNISTLIKDSLNHHLTEIGWMQSPLTKSDRFLVDLLITFIYNSPFPVSSRTCLNVMSESEPKNGFMYIRCYGSLRSKDYLYYSY